MEKETIELVKKMIEDGNLSQEIAEKYCPELKESEDERIRKSLIDMLKNDEKHYLKEIAWLEKQGVEKYIDPDTLIQERVDALANIVAERIPVDKVEPIKVGDWIINKTSNLVYRVDSILLPQSKCYYLSHNGEIVLVSFTDEQNYRLWTLQDAKEGDVLAIEWNQDNDVWEKILIFKALNDSGVKGYGSTFKNKNLFFTDQKVPYYSETWTKTLHPATKEQRGLLFQRMQESGYEWDAEKKELKKIEQKPTEEWSEEDEGERKRIIGLLEGWLSTFKETCYAEDCKCGIDWLKSLKPQKPLTNEEIEQAKKRIS